MNVFLLSIKKVEIDFLSWRKAKQDFQDFQDSQD